MQEVAVGSELGSVEDMKQGLFVLQWRPLPSCPRLPLSLRGTNRYSLRALAPTEISAGGGDGGGELTARERRQLRKERREIKAGSGNWREEVEERLLKKPKKRRGSWMEELNLDNLARLGPQWWVLRVSRVISLGQEAVDRLVRSLASNFPDLEFKVYYPAVKEKRKLKNGSYSEKSKPLFPGCVFLYCILNKEIHDFIRECDGIGGFVGSKVGNTKRQINKPKPVPLHEMEAIFQQAKEEQKKSDQAFEEEECIQNLNSYLDSGNSLKSIADDRKCLKKDHSTANLLNGENSKHLAPGVGVRVLSGPFKEFTGCLKELDHKSRKATVGFMLFGKETFVDLEVDQIVAETA